MANSIIGAAMAMAEKFKGAWSDFVPSHRTGYLRPGFKTYPRWREGKRPGGKFYSKRYYGKYPRR